MVRQGSLSCCWACACLWGARREQPAVNLYLDAVALRELGQDRLAVDKLDEVVKADPDFILAYVGTGQGMPGTRRA